jgi:Peptidase family M1 domain
MSRDTDPPRRRRRQKTMNKLILPILITLTTLTAGAQTYFQQRVNYTIAVILQDSDRSIDGNIRIQYINHSPDTLTYIWIHCWPNAYKNDRTALSEQLAGNGETNFYFSDPDHRGYINRLEFRVDGQLARMEDHPQYIDIIKVILPNPLSPGDSTILTTPFHVRLPYNFSRGGYVPHASSGPSGRGSYVASLPGPTASGAYLVTQWYPKPAVYDSRGWHPMPLLDDGDFYGDFGSFDVSITVPKTFVVAATGELQGGPGRQDPGPPPPATLPSTTSPAHPPHPITRQVHPAHPITHPAHAPATSRVATSAHSIAPAAEPTKTLHYHQDNISDFAWFADRHFHTEHDTLQLASGRIIDVYSFYTPAANPAWRHSIAYMKDAIRFHSALIGEYPFNVVTAVEAKLPAQGGIEYPTITSIDVEGDEESLDYTIGHEIGHNWFYAALGTDERRYPWMDEGINTYYDYRYLARKYPPRSSAPASPHSSAPAWLLKKWPGNSDQVRMNTVAAIREDQPISTPSEDFTAENYKLIAYTKTAIWMKALADTLGTPLFDSCMREYFREWQFRHPYPDDFKTIITSTSHRNLDTLFALLDKKGPLPPFPPQRPIRPTLLFNIRNADRIDYLNIGPVAGYNEYDKFMIGVLIHNFNLPPERWQLLLAPLYATGSHQLDGVAHFGYAWYPGTSAFRLIEAGVNASRFSTIDGADSNGHQLFGGFYKVVPYVRLYFPKSSPRSTRESWLEWKTYLIGEKELNHYVQKSTDSLYYPTAGSYNFRYLNQLSFTTRDSRVLYPYSVKLQVQQAAPFYRINFTENYFFNYEKSGGLDVRVFGAKFGYLGGRDPSQDLTGYEPKLTAVRGTEDYTYDNYFLGRSEYNGLASGQILMRDGDLKLRTDLFQGLQGRSDNWVASLNLSSTLPPQIIPAMIPLKVFLDIGTYAEAWAANPPTSHFLYVGGLELSFFHDVFRIYAPLVYSGDFSNQLKTVPGQNGFFQKLSFSIDFQNIPIRKIFGYTPF